MSQSESIISVQNLSKRYLLGHQGEKEKYTALRDVIARNVRGLARTTRDMLTGRQVVEGDEVEEFWALKDVSFEVKRGEVLGIIGRNGAGKSTLLKILSRITEPTMGRIEINGRVASLLEVGTGFHPELTGRENIFLNGAILGMTRAEIRKSFDEIIAFAEVEKFLDTPVKRYSSGMYVRLAFAVAAHLNPEILIVDEVLAVGDAQFQKKCMGKMKDVASAGRTVLFVSHNLNAIESLCDKGLLLKGGTRELYGIVSDVCAAYTKRETDQDILNHITEFPDPKNHCPLYTKSVTLLVNGLPSSKMNFGDSIAIDVSFRADRPLSKPNIGFVISSANGNKVINSNNNYLPSPSYESPVKEGTIRCDLGVVPMMSGLYEISIWAGTSQLDQQHIPRAITFKVVEKDIWKEGFLPPSGCSEMWWNTRFELK